jgi:putative restriction endonuclease
VLSALPYVAVTDAEWFAHLRARAGASGVLDEVNFWNPSGAPLKGFEPGTPVFFRLKAPLRRLAGFGFFAAFQRQRLRVAWDVFGTANGCDDPLELSRLTGRGLDDEIGCTALRDATFWPDDRHVAWGEEKGWGTTGPQRGRTETDPARVEELYAYLRRESATVPEDLVTEEFVPLDVDDREVVLARTRRRVGQGTFRTRLLEAYRGRCAITGEHTQVVLDGAHIQPYLGPRSNRLQNGILLTKEFHALLDEGFITITPEYRVRVSPRLREEWQNGHRYYPYDEQPLLVRPSRADDAPGRRALEWHANRIFKG